MDGKNVPEKCITLYVKENGMSVETKTITPGIWELHITKK